MMPTIRRVGDMLVRLKTPVEIQDTEFYKRLTIRINHQGVSVRDTEIGANIGTKSQFRVRAGDFILSKIDARQGAFGIVPPAADGGIITGNFWTFRVDNQLVDTDWFLQFTNSDAFLDLCKRSSTGNTHRKYLNEAIFLNHELAIPSLEEQRKAVESCKSANERFEEVQHEITHQQSLLGKLKQAILQEAIQGKLTADWRAAHRDVEPAGDLLQRIQAEKTRLVAAKKLRPEKPLPKVTPAEIPFKIPKGWEWCRLIELSEKTGSGSTPSGGKTAYSSSGIPFLRSQNVHDNGLVLDDVARISAAIHQRMEGTTVYPEDLLLNITGGSIGRCAIVSNEIEEANVNQHVAIIRPVLRPSGKYLHAVILSPYFQGKIEEAQTGAGREGLPKNKMDRIAIPLPPLAEQAAIVVRVEAMMTTCRALEEEIEHARTHAAHLLQAVLKEAFAPAASVEVQFGAAERAPKMPAHSAKQKRNRRQNLKH